MWIKVVGMDELKIAKMFFAMAKQAQKNKSPDVTRGQFTCTDEYEKYGIGKTTVQPHPVTKEERKNWELFWTAHGK